MVQGIKKKRFFKIFSTIFIIISLFFLLILNLLYFLGGYYFYNFALNPNSENIIENSNSDYFKGMNEETLLWFNNAQDWFKNETKNDENIIEVTSFNTTLYSYYIENESNNHNYVILVHGYKGEPIHMAHLAYEYYNQGFSTLIPNNRGHALSFLNDESQRISMGYYDKYDILEYIKYLKNYDKDAKIILHGISMGAATVMMLSEIKEIKELGVKGIIEDCGYTSVYDIFLKVAKEDIKIPSFPIINGIRMYTKLFDNWDLKDASSIKALKNTDLPLFFIHGKKDNFVPFRMLNELMEAYLLNENNKNHYGYLVVENATHGNASMIGYSKNGGSYYQKVFEFIDKYL